MHFTCQKDSINSAISHHNLNVKQADFISSGIKIYPGIILCKLRFLIPRAKLYQTFMCLCCDLVIPQHALKCAHTTPLCSGSPSTGNTILCTLSNSKTQLQNWFVDPSTKSKISQGSLMFCPRVPVGTNQKFKKYKSFALISSKTLLHLEEH